MARIILVTGGSRSGKSDYARARGESIPGPRVFVATCPVVDEETAQRIRRHQQERSPFLWDTVEEPLELERAIGDSGKYNVILVDCLTLWINNLLFHAGQMGQTVSEGAMTSRAGRVLSACSAVSGTMIFVTNEVGWGIVPENPMARLYRDLVGRCNRALAASADEVILVASGIPLVLKNGEE
jgi:adenosylcobinamide kinase/adenosylcobinamide-phosphate guanylyltransferase